MNVQYRSAPSGKSEIAGDPYHEFTISGSSARKSKKTPRVFIMGGGEVIIINPCDIWIPQKGGDKGLGD